MRALTRPLGREAVERHTASGWWTEWVCACVNQVWNCVKGLGSSWVRLRESCVYWSAWELVLSFAGATVRAVSVAGAWIWVGKLGFVWVLGGRTDELRGVLRWVESHFGEARAEEQT
jgi:hypothetical protein